MSTSSTTNKVLDPEERKGLLSTTDDDYDDGPEDHSDTKPWKRKKIVFTAFIFIALLITGVIARALLRTRRPSPRHPFTGTVLRSNGTHEFKRTVLIVSIDGLRLVTVFESFPSSMTLHTEQTILTAA